MRRARPKRHGLWGSLAAVAVAAVLADAAWLLWRWHRYMPDAEGAIPESAFIESYRDARRDDPSLPPLRWQPAPLAGFPRHVIKPFIIAEDARFFVHRGIDLGAIRVAIREYLETAGRLRGASTITQQTAKNLFLSRRRNVLRKWHELVMSLLLEAQLPKDRILEIYLNVAEFGIGLFGLDAAARFYFGRPASALTAAQAAALAATLPAPDLHNPATRTQSFRRRASRIAERSSRESYPTSSR